MMTYEQAVEYIMQIFPFEEVEQYMKEVDWRWYHTDGLPEIPSIDEIKEEAHKLLIGIKGYVTGTMCGGLEVRLTARRRGCILGLGFGKELLSEDESRMLFWVEVPYNPYE